MEAGQKINTVAPALQTHAQGLIAELWKRPALSPRDRSIKKSVTKIAIFRVV
jgi:hypothetical protein